MVVQENSFRYLLKWARPSGKARENVPVPEEEGRESGLKIDVFLGFVHVATFNHRQYHAVVNLK